MSIVNVGQTFTVNNTSASSNTTSTIGGVNLTIDNTDAYTISTSANWSILGSTVPVWGMSFDASGSGSNIVKNVTISRTTGNTYLSGDYNNTFQVYNSNSSNIVTGIAPPSTSGGSFGAFGMKLNAAAVPQWVVAIDGSGQDICRGQALDSNDNFYITGVFSNVAPVIYNASNLTTASVSSNIANAGGVMQSSGAQAGFAVKYNSNGIAQWASYVAGLCNVFVTSSTMDSQSNLYIAGQYNTVPPVMYDGQGGSYVGNVTTYAGSGIAGSNDGLGTLASFNACRGIACDPNNNVYVAEYLGCRVRKINPFGNVTLLAGGGVSGDGIGSNATFTTLSQMAIDSNGDIIVCDSGSGTMRKIYVSTCNVVTLQSGYAGQRGVCIDSSNTCYVAETNTHRIHKLTFTTSNSVTSTVFAGKTNVSGSNDGIGTLALFNRPLGLCSDRFNNIYVADASNSLIRKITPAGVVTTVAGNGVSGNIDGPSNLASFLDPEGVVCDLNGNIYVCQTATGQIRMINSNGIVSTYAGAGVTGYADGVYNKAIMNSPYQIAYNNNLNILYTAEQGNNRVRRIIPTTQPFISGDQASLGKSVATVFAGVVGTTGSNNGASNVATFNVPVDIALDGGETLYITDSANHVIRRITPDGVVSLFVGSNTSGFVNGLGTQAAFNNPRKIVIDSFSNLYVCDYSNHAIRKITSNGVVTTFAGGQAGNADALGTLAGFSNPIGLAIDNSNALYVCDRFNFKIRKVLPSGQVSTIAGDGVSRYVDGLGTLASFAGPLDVVWRPDGGLYVSDCNNVIRSISALGDVTTYAGNSSAGIQDGVGTAAAFNKPENMYLDNNGFLYVSDRDNQRIRRVSPDRTVLSVLGNGLQGTSNGTGTAISFSTPQGIAVSPSSNVMYVCEAGRQCIRRITNFNQLGLQIPYFASRAGFVAVYDNTGAGTRTLSISGSNSLVTVNNVAVDTNSNIYVAGQYTGSPTVTTTPFNLANGFTFPVSSSQGNLNSGFVLKCLPNTTPTWVVKVDNSDTDNNIVALAVDATSNVYAAGQYTSPTTLPVFYNANRNAVTLSVPPASGTNTQSAYLVKYDNAGNPQWTSVINGPGNNQITKINVGANGRVYVAGASTNSNVVFYNSDVTRSTPSASLSKMSVGILTFSIPSNSNAIVSWTESNYAYAQVTCSDDTSTIAASPLLYQNKSFLVNGLTQLSSGKTYTINVTPYSYQGDAGTSVSASVGISSIQLDALASTTPPYHVYSCVKRISTYTGPNWRLRNNNTNTEADVYIDECGVITKIETYNNAADSTIRSTITGSNALSNWLAGALARVRRWYDQGGNGGSIFQAADITLQPVYIPSSNAVSFTPTRFLSYQGGLTVNGGMAVGDFTILCDYMPLSHSSTTNVWNQQEGIIYGDVTGTNSDWGIMISGYNTSSFGVGTGPTDDPVLSIQDAGLNNQSVMAATRSSSTGFINLYRNGVKIASGTRDTGTKIGPNRTNIGYNLDAMIKSLVIYTQVLPDSTVTTLSRGLRLPQ